VDSAAPVVGWTESGGLGIARLAGPRRNAIGDALLAGLERAIAEVERSEVRGVLLAAAGPLFCPGIDLIEARARNRRSMRQFMERFARVLLALWTLPKPVVAAIEGHALAGGCLLALTADRRLLKNGARFGMNGIRLGVPLPLEAIEILRASVALHRFEDAAVRGRDFSEDAAIEAGLAHELLGEARFEERCLGTLATLSGADERALAAAKIRFRGPVAERALLGAPERLEAFLDAWFSAATQGRIEAIVAGFGGREDGR
jgi:enoyl-CoA hydratase